MKSPLVSLVITCYNYGEYVIEAIESVLSQTYSNIELIVIDDGSTDNSVETISKYKDCARIIAQDNKGVVHTRNEALKVANGEYICFLDADDYLDKDYIQKTVAVARKQKVDIVYTDYRMFGDRQEISNFPEYDFEVLKNHNYIHISSLVRISAAKNILFDEKLSKLSHEDWDFFLHLCADGATAQKVNNTFLNYRIHGAGRNNILRDIAQDKKFIETNKYIINKRVQEGYAKDFDYLSIRLTSVLYERLDKEKNRLEYQLKKMKSELEAQKNINDGLHMDIEKIRQSKSYKVGKIATSPVRAAKKMLK